MGFFKKLFRGVKKVFKKVGKGIKKVVGKVGKFMNKIGIVGQIAMSFLLPGIGGLIGKAAGAMMASSNAVIAGAGNFLNAAVNIATKAGSMVKSVGDGVMKVVGQTVGTAINKIPGAGNFIKGFTKGAVDITQMKNFTGPGGIMDTVSKSITDVAAKGRDLFSMETLTGKNKFAVAADARKQISQSLTEDLKARQDVSTEEFTQRVLEGESPMDASLTKTTYEPGKVNMQNINLEDAILGEEIKPAFDASGMNVQLRDSLLSPQVPTLTPEQIAAGARYDVGSPTGVTMPKESFASKARSALNPQNVGRAVRDTFGTDFAQDTTPYGSQFSMDIPQQEEYQLYAYGAQRFQRSQNQMTTVQYFTGVNEQAA